MKKTPTFNVDLLCFPFFLNVKKKKTVYECSFVITVSNIARYGHRQTCDLISSSYIDVHSNHMDKAVFT